MSCKDTPLHLERPLVARRAHGMDVARWGSSRLRGSRLHLSGVRRSQDDAGTGLQPRRSSHRHRRKRRDRGSRIGGSYATHSVAEFLDELAAGDPTPGGGAAAALAARLAAGPVAMVARYSVHSLSEAPEIAARADHLRHDALVLAARDAQAYSA